MCICAGVQRPEAKLEVIKPQRSTYLHPAPLEPEITVMPEMPGSDIQASFSHNYGAKCS